MSMRNWMDLGFIVVFIMYFEILNLIILNSYIPT